MGIYKTIVVDPPWSYNDKLSSGNTGFGQVSGSVRGAAHHYETMTLEAIFNLGIEDYAADDCHLYLWVTNAFMEDAIGLPKAWGFATKTILTWVKPQIGMGHYYRNNTEHILFAVRGSLPTMRKDIPTAFTADRKRHSQKPDTFFDIVEMMSPGPYLSVFERKLRMRWDSIGDEVGTRLGQTPR